MTRLRYTLFVLTIFLVLALSAMSTAPALADDSTPPPTETPTAEIPPTAEITEPVSPTIEVAPVEEETIPQQETTAELLASVPEGTDLVVLNAEGDTVPLASEEAAQLIEIVDPMWCPTGVKPGGAGCSINYTSLTALVIDFNDGIAGMSTFAPSGNGVIWIQGNTDSGTAGTSILIDGQAVGFTGIANFSLVLKGGWNGCNPGCVNTVNINNPSKFDQSISITNWNGDITFSDITFTGVTVGSASHSAALNIDTNKKITLTNVIVTQNTGAGIVNGAYLDNNDGSVASDVVITNSVFAVNKNDGLTVYSDGAITISNLVVNSNGGAGAYLDNDLATTAKAVTLSGNSNQVKFNGGNGLVINSKGAITVNSISANNNGGFGAYLDNQASTAGSNVTLTGTNSLKENDKSGLEVYSDGIVTLSNISANKNGAGAVNGFGAYVDNTSASAPKAVTLTGINEFNGNYNAGLFVLSRGTITVNKLTANFNQSGEGALLDNTGNGPTSPQNITLIGNTTVNNNASSGLFVQTFGAITLGSIRANDNAINGASLQNSFPSSITRKPVTLSGLVNEFNNNNTGDGLHIVSLGVITLNNVQSNGNGLFGLYADNASADVPGGITLNGTNGFSNNLSGGLAVFSNGAIKLNNISANLNGGAGAILDNRSSGNASPQSVTINGLNNFNDNGDSGLVVAAYGAITTNNLTANQNGQNLGSFGYGALLDNCDHNGTTCNTITSRNVIMNGTNTFNGNYLGGLFVVSRGSIKTNNLTASLNGDNGATLDNQNNFGFSSFGVTLTGTNLFENNGVNGLTILSHGAVTISSLTANLNFAHGASIDTNNKVGPVAKVTLTGNNTFNGNGDGTTGGGQDGTGLVVFSDSVITINNLTANENTEEGAHLEADSSGNDNTSGPNMYWTPLPAAVIKLTGFNIFSGNGLDGLNFASPGNVDISKITADNNGGDGVEGYSANGNITISCGSMTNNTGYGWRLQLFTASKLITLKGVFALGNTAGNELLTDPFTVVTIRTCP